MANELDEKNVEANPIELFREWFNEALGCGAKLPESMTLATANREGKPSGRVVLLKGVDDSGFVFYTNYRSRKARELEENPQAALVFYWSQIDRQVRVEGRVERASSQESDVYFQTRPRESQIGAIASPQSEVIESRKFLEKRFRELAEQFGDGPIERPAHWGGYRVVPDRIEFWQNRKGRLHDRILYERQNDGSWTLQRLAP